jgi:putative aldouronate transport system permease protein
VTTLIFGFIAPILLALIINQIRNPKRKKVMQTAVYLPHFISTVVMVGILQVFLSPETGVLVNLLNLDSSVNLMGSDSTFVPVYVISEVWQHCGWNSIIYLAALSSIDTQLYESADIDGANRFQKILHVDIPALVPTMVILLIMNMGGVLNAGFEKIFLMQNSLNLSVSEVISTYVYKIGILNSQFSYSTAIGLFNNIINFLFLVLANGLSKKYTNRSLW